MPPCRGKFIAPVGAFFCELMPECNFSFRVFGLTECHALYGRSRCQSAAINACPGRAGAQNVAGVSRGAARTAPITPFTSRSCLLSNLASALVTPCAVTGPNTLPAPTHIAPKPRTRTGGQCGKYSPLNSWARLLAFIIDVAFWGALFITLLL